MRIDFVEFIEENKSYLSQLEDVDEVYFFKAVAINNHFEYTNLLVHIETYNPHKDDKSFNNKIKEIDNDVRRLAAEFDDVIAVKINELHIKGLSFERIQQFLQFKADDSHVGDQC